MSQKPKLPEFVKNHELFQDYYLDAYLSPTIPLSPEEITQGESLESARNAANDALDEVLELWGKREKQLTSSESNVEDFVVEVSRILGLSVSSQGTIRRKGETTQRVDLVLFATDADNNQFAENWKAKLPAGKAYAQALAVVEVEKVGKDFEPGGDSRDKPFQQIVGYLTHTAVPWGILTDGHRWRLYRRFDPPSYEEYLEINLKHIVEMPAHSSEQQKAFWWFYTFFHRNALNRHERNARVDAIYEGSERYATGVQASLRNQAFQVVEELARGIFVAQSPANPDQNYLAKLYEKTIIILFRLLFLKFAEDKAILPVNNPRYQKEGYTGMEEELLQTLDTHNKTLSESADQCVYWMRLQTLFTYLNTGNPDMGIFAYNGGLFRPDRVENISIPDAFLARAIDHLVRIARDGKKLRISYRGLQTRHLGSIYESLLEQHLVFDSPTNTIHLVSTSGERSNQRRTSGSYYTPDYIVKYIVQQTIDPLCAGKSAAEIAQIRILDPSMGSGHFLVSALTRLAKHHAMAKNQESEPYPFETDEAFELRTVTTKEHVEASERELVEHCIYGVDLNPLAVELAKLALWLSTLSRDRALSFLDHHLRVGNSLVGTRLEHVSSLADLPANGNGNGNGKKKNGNGKKQNGNGKKQNGNGKKQNGNGHGTIYQMGLFEQIVWRVRDTLLAYFQQIADLPSTTDYEIHLKEQAYTEFREYSKPFRQVANLWVSSHFENPLSDQQSLQALMAVDDYYANPPDHTKWTILETQPWFLKAQEVAEHYQFFHWELEFPQMFLHETKGFDVVVGNPPYVRQETFKPLKPFFALAYPDIYHGSADLYVYFIGQGIALLRQEGRLSYINSNKWFRVNYGKKIRTYVPQKVVLEQIVDFRDAPIFADATTYPSIMVAQKGMSPIDHKFSALSWQAEDGNPENFAERVQTDSIQIKQLDIAEDGWRFETVDNMALLHKLRGTGKTFGEYVQGQFYRGVLTGLNEVFVVDRATRDQLIAEHPSSADLLKPYLRGRDVKRWRVEFAEHYIIFARRGIDITQYPAILNYLSRYKDRLTPGVPHGRKKGNYQWYELQDSIDYWQMFEKPKIIIPTIADSVSCTADSKQFYTNNATSFCVTDNIYYILGLLNSSTLYWYIRQKAAEIQHGFLQFFMIYVAEFPIPNASASQQETISTLAQQLSDKAKIRFELQEKGRHTIQRDLGTPERKLNQKLTHWWELDFITFCAEVKKAFRRDLANQDERDRWESWLQSKQAQHTQYTNDIVQMEKALNQHVYQLFNLTDEEIAIIEQETQYQYGK